MPTKASILVLWLLALIATAPPHSVVPRTIFADEFDGRELDRSHWNVIVTGRTVNNEQQAYADSEDVLSVSEGMLVILNLALGGNYPAKVNGARAPYPELSEAAVQSIKNDDAKVLVDWVRLTSH